MSPEAWIGLAAIAVTILGGLIYHVVQDARTDAELRGKIGNIEEQIGTHDSGIRGELHRQVGLISRLRAVVYFIGQKLKLDIMRDLDDNE